jgi:hypothetical protein
LTETVEKEEQSCTRNLLVAVLMQHTLGFWHGYF